MKKPELCVDFSASKFPIKFEALHHKTREVVWSLVVEKPPGPGQHMTGEIPGLAAALGYPVSVRVTFGDGEVYEAEPPEAGLVH